MVASLTLSWILSGLSVVTCSDGYPTRDRVQFVVECMALRGAANYSNMYGCSCMLDVIAKKMTYEDFVRAESFLRLENSRGERGGLFRNSSEVARKIRREYRSLREQASKECFARTIEPPPINK